jgi:hypothetical protein
MLIFILFLGEIDLNTNLVKIISSKYLETAKIATFTQKAIAAPSIV